MSNSIPSETGAAYKAVAVSPHDTNDLAAPCRSLYVGGAGNVEVIMEGDTDAVVFSAVPAGTVLPIRVSRVRAASTTATLILALY
jgi:hypothetical protein